MTTAITPADLRFENHGSIVLLRDLTEAGTSWIEENVADSLGTFGGAVVIEPRYVGDIIRGAEADGLSVEGR
jgi:hypothetical protein